MFFAGNLIVGQWRFATSIYDEKDKIKELDGYTFAGTKCVSLSLSTDLRGIHFLYHRRSDTPLSQEELDTWVKQMMFAVTSTIDVQYQGVIFVRGP